MTRGRSLFRKYALSLVILVSAALLVSGLVGLYFTYQESKTARLNLQREKAGAAAARITSYISEIESQLGWMRLGYLGEATPEQRRLEYLKLMRQVPAISEVAFVDYAGRETLRVPRLGATDWNPQRDLAHRSEFLDARSDRTYFSPVYFRNESEPYLTMSIAGLQKEAGVTIAEVSLKHIWDVVSTLQADINGLAYLVDAAGHLIAHPDLSLVLRKTDLSALAQVKAARGRLAGAEDVQQVMIGRGLKGDEALIAYAGIDSPLGWNVFVEQPLAEALAPLYASLQRTALLLFGGLVFALAVSLLLARHMVTPIRAIQAGAARIAKGNLDQSIDVGTGDELEALAAEFNNMAKQLQESYASLERKVQERTRDLSESLEQQTATSEVLRTISRSSYDLTRVLKELIASAVRLGRADAGGIYLLQADGRYELRVATSDRSTLREWMEARAPEIHAGSATAAGRAIVTRQPVQVADVRAETGSDGDAAGVRTVLAVPILREGAPVGAVIVLRCTQQMFGETQVTLVTTFADQAGIAIENVRLFSEIQTKSRELESANRHKSEFLANVSHELRTPLNAIIGFSEVLRERMFGEINPKQAEYLEDIHSSGKHLLALINDILNLSKIEAGRMDLELAGFDMVDALQSALGVMRERASRQGVALALEVHPNVRDWAADERKFKQIMLNLLSNAVKFTPEGGKVTVHARRLDGVLEIAVADTGVGISEDHLEEIFDEFKQVGTDHMRRSEGTGLGLALAKKYIELHGGRIQVKSALGCGSTFTFTLPERPADIA